MHVLGRGRGTLDAVGVHSLQKIAIPAQAKLLHGYSARQNTVCVGTQDGSFGHLGVQQHRRRAPISLDQDTRALIFLDGIKQIAKLVLDLGSSDDLHGGGSQLLRILP